MRPCGAAAAAAARAALDAREGGGKGTAAAAAAARRRRRRRATTGRRCRARARCQSRGVSAPLSTSRRALTPLVAALQRCIAALRTRRLQRSIEEELADGTLEGVALEVEARVAAEAARAADLAAAAPSVAQHVLARVQTEIEVRSVGEVGPRIAELKRAARLSLSRVRQLRAARSRRGCDHWHVRRRRGSHQGLRHADGLCGQLCSLVEVHRSRRRPRRTLSSAGPRRAAPTRARPRSRVVRSEISAGWRPRGGPLRRARGRRGPLRLPPSP